MSDEMKESIFENADLLKVEAQEYFELAEAYKAHGKNTEAESILGLAETAKEQFETLLYFMQGLGLDKEYMGVA